MKRMSLSLWLSLLYSASLLRLGQSTCPNHALLGCVLRLKAQRVPFEKNMLNVVFNIATEAKLLRTCRVYSNTMPCFREKIVECGDEKQKRMLDEVGRMLMFICSPFSLQRQRQLIKHQRCISAVLNLPPTTDCPIEDVVYARDLAQCRTNCVAQNSTFLCTMQNWVSEQNVCTLQSLRHKCGHEAAGLYEQMQVTVFEPHFPVICDRVAHPTVAPRVVSKSTKKMLSTTTTTTTTTRAPSTTTKMSTTTTTSTTTRRPSTAAKTETVSNRVLAVSPAPSRSRINGKNSMKTKKITSTTLSSTTIEELRSSYFVTESPLPTTIEMTDRTTGLTSLSPAKNSLSDLWEAYHQKGEQYKNELNELWQRPKALSSYAPTMVSEMAAPTTEGPSTTATPRTIKVINILRRFLPDYIPQLSSIFDQVQDGGTVVATVMAGNEEGKASLPFTKVTATLETNPSTTAKIVSSTFPTLKKSSSNPNMTVVNYSAPPLHPPTRPTSSNQHTISYSTPSASHRSIHRMMPKLEHRSAFLFSQTTTSQPCTHIPSGQVTVLQQSSPLAAQQKARSMQTPSPQLSTSIVPLFPQATIHSPLPTPRVVHLPPSLFAAAQNQVSVPPFTKYPVPTIVTPLPNYSNQNYRISYLSAADRHIAPVKVVLPSSPIQAPSLPDFIKNLGNIPAIPAREFQINQPYAYPAPSSQSDFEPQQNDINSLAQESVAPETTTFSTTTLPTTLVTRRLIRRNDRWKPWYLGGPSTSKWD